MKRMSDKFDLIILGAGSAAFGAAMKADELGAKTAMMEQGLLGGTCVNVGCLPTKHLLEVAKNFHSSNNAQFVGLKTTASMDFGNIISEKDQLIESLRDEKYAKVLDKLSNVTLIEGRARFVSKNQIEGKRRNIRSEQIHCRHRFINIHSAYKRN